MVWWGGFNGGKPSVSEFPAGIERGQGNHLAVHPPQMLSKYKHIQPGTEGLRELKIVPEGIPGLGPQTHPSPQGKLNLTAGDMESWLEKMW